MRSNNIAQKVSEFAKIHGRFHLPWKTNISPYGVWVSEVMLQQTQVQTVISYYQRFMTLFPTVKALSQASIDEVLSAWAGLGYYRRAHHLHECAQQICTHHKGLFPKSVEELVKLKGIGRSTAGAILSQAFNISAPILDGNVKRVLMRLNKLDGYPEQPKNIKQLWQWSESITPKDEVALYTQGIMDLGANICTKNNPKCNQCPVQEDCLSFKASSQHLIPASKPKKHKPTRRCLFALIKNTEDKILVLKRPNKGIWGGLWCLPSVSCTNNFKSFNGLAKPISIGEDFKHAFTHFNLEYKPVIMRQIKEFKIKGRAIQWLSTKEALELGVPAPIKKLLEGNYL